MSDSYTDCFACNGMGWVLVRSRDAEGNRIETDEDCPECGGEGSVRDE